MCEKEDGLIDQLVQIKKYFFPTSIIPRISCQDPRANELISQEAYFI